MFFFFAEAESYAIRDARDGADTDVLDAVFQ